MKLSIITATWNSSATISRTLESLAEQTYQDYEYIVIDGDSSDNTLDIIKNSGVKVDMLVSEKDKGIYDALNKGISLASGDYVGFLHSDDFFAAPSSLEGLVKCLENTNPQAIYADLEYVKKDCTSEVVRYWKSGRFYKKKMKVGWMPPHPTFYMKREMYEVYGVFDLKYRISADYDSLVRYLWSNNILVEYYPQVLVRMRVGGASNRSLKNIIAKTKEDLAIMRRNNLPILPAVIGKNISKIKQFFERAN